MTNRLEWRPPLRSVCVSGSARFTAPAHASVVAAVLRQPDAFFLRPFLHSGACVRGQRLAFLGGLGTVRPYDSRGRRANLSPRLRQCPYHGRFVFLRSSASLLANEAADNSPRCPIPLAARPAASNETMVLDIAKGPRFIDNMLNES